MVRNMVRGDTRTSTAIGGNQAKRIGKQANRFSSVGKFCTKFTRHSAVQNIEELIRVRTAIPIVGRLLRSESY